MSKVHIPVRPFEITSVCFTLGGCLPVEVRIPPVVIKQDDDVEVVSASVVTDRVTFDAAVKWWEQ